MVKSQILASQHLPSLSEVFGRLRKTTLLNSSTIIFPSSSIDTLPFGYKFAFATSIGSRWLWRPRPWRSWTRGCGWGRGLRKCTYCYGENHIVDFCWELYGKPTVHQASFQAEESTSHSHPPTSRVVSGPEEEYNRPCLSILILLGLALKLAWLNKVLPLLVFPLRTLRSLTQVLLIVWEVS